ncbi:hypothetical protein GGF46_000302 [Coemansia sp. RSA 552]|nr:hypothetical protein GGF46_000302 [Coemansia sp. RSA 552]
MMAVSLEGMPSTSTEPSVQAKEMESPVVDPADTQHRRNWEKYWAAGGVEHDQGKPSIALRELLEDHRWLLPRGRCLLAGCGPIAGAQKMLETAGEQPTRLTFAVQDFFTLRPPVRFTFAYEYGFFASIPPAQRQQWAETYARLIVPQGTLIVLLYPLVGRGGSLLQEVTMAECEEFLKRYFVLVRVDPNCQCPEGQEGHELMTVWKRL